MQNNSETNQHLPALQADKSRDAEKLKERAKRFAIPESLSKEEVNLHKHMPAYSPPIAFPGTDGD